MRYRSKGSQKEPRKPDLTLKRRSLRQICSYTPLEEFLTGAKGDFSPLRPVDNIDSSQIMTKRGAKKP